MPSSMSRIQRSPQLFHCRRSAPLTSRIPTKSAATLIVALFLVAPAFANSSEGGSRGIPPTVLLVGDSWAEFMWQFRTLQNTFSDNGYPNLVEDGSSTAISGSTVAEWTQPSWLQSITDALESQPSIEVVQVTFGGNDFLAGQSGGGWYVDISSQDLETLYGQILADAEIVIDHIFSVRPDIEILISLYDYVNFVESNPITCLGPWNDLGNPTPLQVNTAAAELQTRVNTFAAGRDRVTSIGHMGLMQFSYGFPDDGIAPGDIPLPGDLSLPSPIASMFLGLDCIHLSDAGYRILGQNLWDQFYGPLFVGTIFSDGFESGDLTLWSSTSP